MSALPARSLTRGRYAPSPTDDLHLGNLRTALLAWLFSRIEGGQFVLRVEDLDRPRTRPGATERMLADLRWLGLDWDEGPDYGGPYAPYTQSERIEIYRHYLQQLQERGLLSSTPRQILLYQLLGFPLPRFAHVPLMLDEQGQRMAKRAQSMGLEPLRSAGLSPAQVTGRLATSCALLSQEEPITPKELLDHLQKQPHDIIRSIAKQQLR